MQQKHWVSVASFFQHPFGILHQQRVAIVHWIPQLEDKHGICIHLSKLLSELLWRLPVVIKAVAPGDSLELFDLSAKAPIACIGNVLFDMRMLGCVRTPCS